MKVTLEVEVTRAEGRQMSAEMVGDELVALVEGEVFEVEDSVFEVGDVEVLASAKAAKAGTDMDVVLRSVDHLFQMVMARKPINLDGTAEPVVLSEVEEYIESMMFIPDIGPAINKAKVRYHRAYEAKAQEKARKGRSK